MSGRNINRKDNLYTNPWTLGMLEFPKEKDGIIYVRQSSLTQQQQNIHSYEMQTDKFVEHFRNMGCTGHIEIIADDEGMSGTLDIHKRAGLTRVVRMIEEQKGIGWIGAVFVNRLTRDPWLITPGVLMKLCYDHDVWISTLRMHFNFKDEYCQRVFMLEAEESARHLKWMKLILGGARSTASDNGYYDGRFITPGYIVDRTDPQRKRYIVYAPHATVVRWLFRRFLELDGNFPQLCREVEAMPYVFPKFESWVDPKTVSRFSLHRKNMSNRTTDGHYKLFRHGLESILTNPMYLGWWIPLDGGVVENNHEPLVDEVLFTYAHKRISQFSLNGERQKPEKVTRHSQVDALLKKVLKDPDGTPLYASRAQRAYRCVEQRGRLLMRGKFSLSIELIDTTFLEKFFERIQSLDADACSDWEDIIEKKKAEKQEKDGLIRKGIKEAELKMKRINELLTNTDIENPLPKSMVDDLVRQYTGLEAKKAELTGELQETPDEEQEQEETMYEIHTLIPRIVELWEVLPFEKRIRFVGALVREVIISRVSPGWVKMEIHWKMPTWETDIVHIRRGGGSYYWTDEQLALLQAMYPTEDAGDILQALPTRNWDGIKDKACELHIARIRKEKNTIPASSSYLLDMSYEDIVYAEKNGLVLTTKNVQWRN
jgi:hypothetical protein